MSLRVRSRRSAEHSALGEGDAGAVADDDVVEQPDVDQRERVLDAPRDPFVGLARLGNARRVIVGVMITAAQFQPSACLTISRGCTLAPSIVPRNSGSSWISRWRLSSNGELTIIGLMWSDYLCAVRPYRC